MLKRLVHLKHLLARLWTSVWEVEKESIDLKQWMKVHGGVAFGTQGKKVNVVTTTFLLKYFKCLSETIYKHRYSANNLCLLA